MSLWFGRTTAYQRRTARPMATLVAVLAITATITWSVVLLGTTDAPSGSVCPPPALAGGPAPTVLPREALERTPPAPPGMVRIRVLNGGGQRGQANLVASQLGELGFTEASEPTNDPLYPQGNLTCRGHIRFGPAGSSAARTVLLVLPCVPLIRDGRADDSVDVAVGTTFGEVNPGRTARDVLDQLTGPAGQTEEGEVPAATSVDQDLLDQASDTPC